MTAKARVARVEGALSPKAAVLCWLDEVHAYPGLPDYVAGLIAERPNYAPLDRLTEQVAAGVKESMEGGARVNIDYACARAVRQVTFLYLLAIQLQLTAAETIRVEGLRQAALYFWRRTLELEIDAKPNAGDGSVGPTDADRHRSWQDASRSLLITLYEFEEARTLLEERFLDGRRVLGSLLTQEWERLSRQAEALLNSGIDTLGDGPLNVSSVRPTEDLESLRSAARSQAPTRAAELVDLAHARTLQLLGEPTRAAWVMERWLREDLEVGPDLDGDPQCD